MGLEIEKEVFSEEDFLAFEVKLERSLQALADVLRRPGFGQGSCSLGAELELDLIDRSGRPRPINQEVLAEARDPRVTLEVDRFNLEINSKPVAAAGTPFSSLARDLDGSLGRLHTAAGKHDARVVAIGILPTLTEDDLQSSALTDGARYRALSAGLRRLRRAPFPFHITGLDSLTLASDDVAYEGANTSFQVHVRVDPSDFARLHNAAQIATAPVLAAGCNSPIFLGRRLWDETRVALFRQAVDDRQAGEEEWRPARVSFGHGWVREDAHELFAESVTMHEPLLPVVGAEDPLAIAAAGGLPSLAELRLHHGTVWRWNRAVYDPAAGGHLRIELRALPAGPTVTDMIANAAFFVGLIHGLAPDVPRLLAGLPFRHARRNFYKAACRGLDAELVWPMGPRGRLRALSARALIEDLLPIAEAGLAAVGVESTEAKRWLDVVAQRAATGQTGSHWQRQAFDAACLRGNRDEASRDMLLAYVDASQGGRGRPVHEWSLP
ncbi:MAG: glutamate--cysteine ligase [Deltaproteobacteria bacterium]|nr:glutamate--cysteine ligase [Deltaproteobacteria bacterium]